jgi:hypothetical protein
MTTEPIDVHVGAVVPDRPPTYLIHGVTTDHAESIMSPPPDELPKDRPITCAECATIAEQSTLPDRHEAGWRFRHTPGPANHSLTLNICPDHAREGDW